MADTTLGIILVAVRDGIAELASIDASRSKLGVVHPNKATKAIRVFTWFDNDFGRRKDGGKSERRCRVLVGAVVKLDDSKADEQLLQLVELWGAVHAKVEQLAEGDLTNLVKYMKEDAPGINASGFDDADNVGFIGAAWEVEYERLLETE